MNSKDKIRSLFYSTNINNRMLAFELAQASGCYEEIVEEFYQVFSELPIFEEEKKYYHEELDEDAVPLTGLALKRAYLDFYSEYCFDDEMHFSGRNLEDESNKLKTIPPFITNLSFLTDLYLDWNELERIPDKIGKLTNLKTLDLSGNFRLSNLPEALGKLSQLEELDLNGNESVFCVKVGPADDDYYIEMPPCFKHLKKLKYLDLGAVLLERFPDWIHELSSLETLMIYSVWGSYPELLFPETFSQLPKLKTLKLANYTIHVPMDIDKIQTLEHLEIQNAMQVPASIKNLKNLKSLDLSYHSSDYPISYEGYDCLWDLYDKGVPDGVSRLKIYGWEWLKEMTWLEKLTFIHIEPYAFTELEIKELEEALPNCKLILEQK